MMKILPIFGAGCGFVMLSNSAFAENSAGDFLNSLSVATVEESLWEMTGAASLGLAKGNADNLSYAFQFLATYEEGKNEGLISADLLYSEADGVATTDSFRLFGQYNRLLSERVFVGLNGAFLMDEIADVDYRIDFGVSLGYYLIKSEKTSLSFEVGPGLVWEDQGDRSRQFATVRFAERFEHQLSKRSKIWQTVILSPKADDLSDSLLTAEAGIDTLLRKQWSLRTALRYQYDSSPAAGRESEDLSLLMGLSYSLGGISNSDEDEGRRTLKPQDDEPEAIKMGWSSTAALGVSLAKGNADSLSVSLSIDSAYREKAQELFLKSNYSYSEDGGERSADELRASAQYNRIYNERYFAGAGVDFLRDVISDVTYRVTPSVRLGYYLIKNDEMTLSLEGGPGYTLEEVGGVKDEYFSITVAEKFAWELSERMTLKQNLVGTFDPKDADGYLLVGDVLLDTDITENLAWRVAAGWTFDNEPAAGRGKDDTTLTTGIAVRF